MCFFWRSRFFVLAAFLGLTILLLCNPAAAASGFAQGVSLCLHTLLPALFPFFVTCSMVASDSRQKGSFWTALFLSWLCGYAVCASIVRDLLTQGKLSNRDAQLLFMLGCCSGPGFVIGCIGGQMLGSVRTGILLYTVQLIANLLCALLLWPIISKRHSRTRLPYQSAQSATPSVSLSDAITSAADNCLCLCGSVIFFRIVHAILLCSFPVAPVLVPFVSAFLEISSGCADFAALGGWTARQGICFCLSFLSVSVFTQLHAILHGAADLGLLFCSRLLHIPIMLVLLRIAVSLIPGEFPVFSSLAPRVIATNRVSPDAAFVVFLFLCAVLYKICQKNYNNSIHR